MFKLTIVTPEKRILVGQEVEEVTVPAFKGELNILPGHAPLITTLETGVMKWKIKGKELQQLAVISWGYCQVSPEGVNILANIAELPEEIDLEMTKTQLAESEKKVMNELITDEDWAEFQREWAHARAKIDVASMAPRK
ncbi:ATP synthase subunit epsilon [Bdellovibrio bacteriovorus]|uniref:ATP synthase epsilon chain n=1 Tax=Bdellovibrio bacteriovorus TaxID=959 RepID=A0A150WQP5_BDEBC|nr:ATP synthase F1 subunit epsilon [Bdellovibrio bacteriovorus]KYG66696.1 ATP synthase subunit epsilon [Bdellovibrio bacteriovorus]